MNCPNCLSIPAALQGAIYLNSDFDAAEAFGAYMVSAGKWLPQSAEPGTISAFLCMECGAKVRLVLADPPIAGALSASRQTSKKSKPSGRGGANMALNPAPSGRWTLRDRAAQRRLTLPL